MNLHKKIAVVGLGNMGYAIAAGLAKSLSKELLFGYDLHTGTTERASAIMTPCSSALEAATKADIVILAVKPDVIVPTIEQITGVISKKIIVSIAAGTTIAAIEDAAGEDAIVIRVMPNTPALAGEGMSVLAPNKNATQEHISLVETIFTKIGKTLILNEKYLDAVTALSGCGPAYFFTFVQAAADAGVKLGLSRKDAVLLAAQTMKGSAEMLLQTGDEPISLRNKVTSPGGSTISAVHVLERNGVSGILMDAIVEAAHISSKLGVKK